MSGAVSYEHVEKRFGSVVALEEFNLDVPDGTFLVMLGPSGCGKTTALRILAGLERPSAGRILLGERDVTRLEPRQRDVAMVFQSYALYPHMNVAQNIGYPLRIRSVAKPARADVVREAADLLDIGHLLERRPRELSGGQRQRVALARAIVRDPACFLMDEPLSNLDAKLRASMRGELKRLQKRLAATMLYVTHDQVEATTMADLIAVMQDGRLQQIGSPFEIYDRPANRFVATFIGSPALGVIAGAVDRDARAFTTAAGRLALPDDVLMQAAAGEAVELGVRPEEIVLTAPDADGALRAEVYVVEPLGAETLVELRIDDARFVARVEPGWSAPIGSAIGVQVDARSACFFNEQGATVVHRSDRENSRERSVA